MGGHPYSCTQAVSNLVPLLGPIPFLGSKLGLFFGKFYKLFFSFCSIFFRLFFKNCHKKWAHKLGPLWGTTFFSRWGKMKRIKKGGYTFGAEFCLHFLGPVSVTFCNQFLNQLSFRVWIFVFVRGRFLKFFWRPCPKSFTSVFRPLRQAVQSKLPFRWSCIVGYSGCISKRADYPFHLVCDAL